ncbi:MAG TPA: hypothetical protein VKC54_02215 [Patescibacteria group bacterium]|nr:hypothetical protein [Patescibacteria group bacterium]
MKKSKSPARISYAESVAGGKMETIKVTEPPKIPMGFGKKTSVFSGGRGNNSRGQFVPPTMRVTQNKGGGGK